MKKKSSQIRQFVITIIIIGVAATFLPAQVAINNDGTPPDGSAMLDVRSNNKGLLIPRISTAGRNTLTSTAAAGLMVYDKDLDKFFFFNGAIWEEGSTGNLWTKSGSFTNLTNISDYVGIGTTTPVRQFEVHGGTNPQVARLSATGSGAWIEYLSGSTTDWAIGAWSNSIRFLSSTNEFVSVVDQFLMDVNTFRPWSNNSKTLGSSSARWSDIYGVDADMSGNLDVGGNTSISGTASIGTTTTLGQLNVHDVGSYATIYLTPSTTNDSSSLFMGEDPNGNYGMYWKYNGGDNEMELWGKSNSTHYGPHLRIERDNGNIAIGGDFATGYKLSVDGNIICEKLRVDLSDGWPDYVFAADYKLMSLKELDTFIQSNGHLPNIPKSGVIQESGLDVGEMQRLIIEKIEELSLYIIQQQNEIEELKRQLNKPQK